MKKTFGQIPLTSLAAASEIADVARHVESLLHQNLPDQGVLPDSEAFPKPGVDVPDGTDAEEVIERVDSSPPSSSGQEDESHDGAVGGVTDMGVEYLAFYKSFRDARKAPAPNRWGIFFIRRRCLAVATDMKFSTGESFADCLDGLAAFLYAHELYHYRFDAHCLQMEATGGFSLYRPYRRLVVSRPMDEWHEESVANFYGLKALEPNLSLSYPQAVYDYLRDLVANSPGAYADGVKKQTKRKELMVQQVCAGLGAVGPSVWRELVTSIVRMGTNFSKLREPTLSSRLHPDVCPVYWIDWVKGGRSVLVPHVASVSEINNDFIKRYLGGVPDHQSDHSYYRIDNGERVKLPNPHRADLKPHEFHNIISKAGMTSPQFYRERSRTSLWRKGVPRSPVLPARVSKGASSEGA